MPYLSNYTEILDGKIDYDVINWDRFGDEEDSALTYCDGKRGARRNFYDYIKFTKFAFKHLINNKYDMVIIFSLQLCFFMQMHLFNNDIKYIIDIRDFHPLVKYITPSIFEKSEIVVISSPGFRSFLPKKVNSLINHNTRISSIEQISARVVSLKEYPLSIVNIGAARDADINRRLLLDLKNDKNFEIFYHGTGGCEAILQQFASDHGVGNVFFSGKYSRSEELELYKQSNFINVLRKNDSLNNYYALPNRLYYAPMLGVPLLGFEGTVLSSIIEKYGLGLIMDNHQTFKSQIISYISSYSQDVFDRNRRIFLRLAIDENEKFRNMVFEILQSFDAS